MLTLRFSLRVLAFVVLALLPAAIDAFAGNETAVEDYKADAEIGRRIFDYRRYGVKLDVRVVPESGNSSRIKDDDDGFPEFPAKDVGRCVIDLSLTCARQRISRFLEAVRQMKEIILLGDKVKLVKTRVKIDRRSMNESNDSIQRSIDDFFDTFALRISLPRWNGKPERNQIDLTFDEGGLIEGRGKKGGGGGGGGGKGGGKCKMMMMAGLMMVKMKIMGVAAMKSMMMAGMSLMVSMAMIMSKFMKGGGGPWQSGGGGQLKEIVLLTKSSGGGGGGSYGPPPPADSYGAPPSSSYGAPSGGGGYGGGGWGRSFGKRLIMTGYDGTNHRHSPMIGESISNRNYAEYPHHENPQENATAFDWMYINDSGNEARNNSPVEPLIHLGSYNYETDPDSDDAPTNYIVAEPLSARAMDYVTANADDSPTNLIANTNRKDVSYDTNILRPVYTDEWQATAEKVNPLRAVPAKLNFKRLAEKDGSSAGAHPSFHGV